MFDIKKSTLILVVMFLSCLNVSIFGDCCAEKKMVIVIPSYNNKDWYKKNLDSVFCQNYSNYRVIYIDDCSPDETGQLVETYIREKQLNNKVTLIKNKTRQLAMANHYRAVHMCDDQEIVLQLDGDDWFPDANVLAYINDIYENPNIWITYGQFEYWPQRKIGFCAPVTSEVVEKSLWRTKAKWTPGQLRTFYAWLFKQIKLEDLIFDGAAYPEIQGKFYATNCDPACYLPMMEMAAERHKFIDRVIYIYNVQTLINDSKVHADLLAYTASLIRSKPPYRRLALPVIGRVQQFEDAGVDIVCFVSSFIQCNNLLATVRNTINKVGNIIFIEHASDHWSSHHFHEYNYETTIEYPKELELKNVINQCMQEFSREHLLLINEDYLPSESIDISRCIVDLERTFAHAFLLSLSLESAGNAAQVPFVELEENLVGLRIEYARPVLTDIKKWGVILLRKSLMQEVLQFGPFNQLKELYVRLRGQSFDKKIILCNRQPKVGFLDYSDPHCQDQKLACI